MWAAIYILAIGFWTALLYFFFNPWAAGIWLLICIAFGFLIHSELREMEIKEPESSDLIDFDAELKCRGRLPRDKDYESVGSGRRAA